jgi:hypothetical protein
MAIPSDPTTVAAPSRENATNPNLEPPTVLGESLEVPPLCEVAALATADGDRLEVYARKSRHDVERPPPAPLTR